MPTNLNPVTTGGLDRGERLAGQLRLPRDNQKASAAGNPEVAWPSRRTFQEKSPLGGSLLDKDIETLSLEALLALLNHGASLNAATNATGFDVDKLPGSPGGTDHPDDLQLQHEQVLCSVPEGDHMRDCPRLAQLAAPDFSPPA